MIARILGLITQAMQCYGCGAWFATDAEGWAHIQNCAKAKGR